MPIPYRCTECGRAGQARDEHAGRVAACPQCGGQVTVPRVAPAVAPPPPSPPAAAPPLPAVVSSAPPSLSCPLWRTRLGLLLLGWGGWLAALAMSTPCGVRLEESGEGGLAGLALGIGLATRQVALRRVVLLGVALLAALGGVRLLLPSSWCDGSGEGAAARRAWALAVVLSAAAAFELGAWCLMGSLL